MIEWNKCCLLCVEYTWNISKYSIVSNCSIKFFLITYHGCLKYEMKLINYNYFFIWELYNPLLRKKSWWYNFRAKVNFTKQETHEQQLLECLKNVSFGIISIFNPSSHFSNHFMCRSNQETYLLNEEKLSLSCPSSSYEMKLRRGVAISLSNNLR